MVPSTFSRLKAARCLPVVLAALIFAGCGTHTPDQSTAYMQGTAQADSAFYLQQMQQSSDDTRINWQLLAIRALVKEGKTGQAVELFNQLPQELNDNQRREKTLLAAEIKLAQKDFAGAQNLLAKITPADLEQNQQARYWQAKIDASQGRPSIDLLRALIAQEPLLGAKEKQQNIDATWQALSSMTQEQANTLVINADENILQGWLDLQRVWFDNRNDPDMMKAGIADWQKRYPNNPGAKMLPTQLVNVKAFKPASTNKIALLLPLNGQAAVFGRTIQQGFEAAKNIGTQPVAAQVIIQIGHMMARLISVCILSNHTCTKDRQFVVVRRVIRKHAVKLLAKALFSSHQTNKTIHIMLYRPEIMPCIAFTNMRRIFLGMEILDKITFIIFGLHKRSSRIVHIPVILRTGIESIRNVLPSHLGSHFSYTKIIERIFQCS